VQAKGAHTSCISVVDSQIAANHYDLEVFADNTLVSGNEIDHFGDDGIDYGASNITITRNYIHDAMDWNISAHMDGMQGYPGSFTNVLIDSNRIIREADPNLPFPTYLQAIDAFDGDWTNLTVANNVVVTRDCWGIDYGGVHGGKIINNTVVSDDLTPARCYPLIAVGEKTHQGSPSHDVVIRNNLSNGLSIFESDSSMVMDHNICSGIEGKCAILPTVNGKSQWGIFKPCVYGDHNIIDARGNDSEFLNFDPAKFVFDLRLKPGARAVGAGNPDGAPAVDITGAARGNPADIGAYPSAQGNRVRRRTVRFENPNPERGFRSGRRPDSRCAPPSPFSRQGTCLGPPPPIWGALGCIPPICMPPPMPPICGAPAKCGAPPMCMPPMPPKWGALAKCGAPPIRMPPKCAAPPTCAACGR
jgi:hypothetical protein